MRIAWLLLFALGCLSSYELVPIDPVPDATTPPPPDAEPPPLRCATELDVLLVVDDSPDGAVLQQRLNDALPDFLAALEGAEAFDSIHVGAVSTDLGAGGLGVDGCTSPDDAILGAGRSAECTLAPPFVTLPDARDAACLLAFGSRGCGFEQPLEAALRATTPSDSRFRFLDGSGGHADGANAGFLRPGAKLAVVVVTNEDDCSVRDPEVFDAFSTRYPESLPTRCWQRADDALHATRRYLDGLLAGRDPRDVALLALAGVPLAPTEGLLDHPDMQLRDNPFAPDRPTPVCGDDELEAAPARRLVSVVDGLSRRGALARASSICHASYVPALSAFAGELTAGCEAR